jgi:hypothetical protein
LNLKLGALRSCSAYGIVELSAVTATICAEATRVATIVVKNMARRRKDNNKTVGMEEKTVVFAAVLKGFNEDPGPERVDRDRHLEATSARSSPEVKVR